MTIITKTIGRLPVNLGDYDSTRSYGKKNRCNLYGCEWESRHDNNTSAPAVWDGGDSITPNTTDWILICGSYEAWLMNQDKRADAPFSGLGRVTLKKNIQNIGGTDKNVLTQDMFYKDDEGSRVPNTNTIFVIKYDFDLNGETITLPSNTVLHFDGGSLSGGTIVGNKTILLGAFDLSSISHYGAFFDNNNNLYGFYGNKGIEFKNDILTVIDSNNLETERKGFQSAANYMNYYVIGTTSSGASSTDAGILILNRDFSVYKYGYIDIPIHSNSMCIRGDVCYIGYQGSIAYFNIKDFIENGIDGALIQTNSITAASGAISYDSFRDLFIIRGSNYLNTYDNEFNLLSSHEIPSIVEYLEEKIGIPNGGSVQDQDSIVINGILYNTGRVKQSSDSTTYYNFIIATDLVSNQIVGAYKINDVFPYLENEGICVDYDNPSQFVVFCNSATDLRVILSVSFDATVNTNVQHTQLSNIKANVLTTAIRHLYVNNTFSGLSDGSPTSPFKSIREAVVFCGDSGVTYITIAKTDKIYNEGDLRIDGTNSIFIEGESVNNKPSIKGNWYIDGSTVEIKYVDFVEDAHLRLRLSTILIRQSDLDLYSDNVFMLAQTSDVNIENVNINSGKAFIELDDIYSAPSEIKLSTVYVNSDCFLLGKAGTACSLLPVMQKYNSRGISFGENTNMFGRSSDNVIIAYTLPIYMYFQNAEQFINEMVYLSNHVGGGLNCKFLLYTEMGFSADNNHFPAGVYEVNGATPNKIIKRESYNDSLIRLTSGNATIHENLYTYIGQLFYNSSSHEFGIFGDTNRTLYRVDGSLLSNKRMGTTLERPVSEYVGFQYFDTTLGKPIYWNGTAWVDATGTTVS